MTRPAHLVITDSGLGGLAICAGIEMALRLHAMAVPPRITYVNAWPEEGRGYNDLPDMAARAAALDRALAAIDAMAPDRVVIACNTLSIVYAHTAHRRRAPVPVHGIVEAGVAMFASALTQSPASALVLIGTRTTIESAVHAEALGALGFDPRRLAGASCHGLATAIEGDPFGQGTDAATDACCARAAAAAPEGTPLHVGLCCTHYGFVRPRIESALARHARRQVVALDPNTRLAREVVSQFVSAAGAGLAADTSPGAVPVRVVSKVTLPDAKRHNVASIVEDLSPATARALRGYVHVPDLF